MSELSVQSLVEKYLSEARIMQLATVRGGQPWICSLHLAADSKSNIYWISKSNIRHSEEITNNPSVAIAVAVKTQKPLIGVQAEGSAAIVTDPEQLRSAMDLYVELQGTDKVFADGIVAGTNEYKLYKFTPKRFSLFDQVNFSEQPTQVWDVSNK